MSSAVTIQSEEKVAVSIFETVDLFKSFNFPDMDELQDLVELAVHNPNTPPETLLALHTVLVERLGNDEETPAELLAHPSFPFEQATTYFLPRIKEYKDQALNVYEAKHIASNPNVPEVFLAHPPTDSYIRTKWIDRITHNPTIPLSQRKDIVHSVTEEWWERNYHFNNTDCHPALPLHKKYVNGFSYYHPASKRQALLAHPEAPKLLKDELLKHPGKCIRSELVGMASNPAIAPDEIDRLLSLKNTYVFIALAENPRVGPEALKFIVRHGSLKAREKALSNPLTPVEVAQSVYRIYENKHGRNAVELRQAAARHPEMGEGRVLQEYKATGDLTLIFSSRKLSQRVWDQVIRRVETACESL